ncbi:MAG: ankyrin repeat domain-containing protein [Bacteroidales bacterium]|nr:ankyrin repeat domain-containing protein [Bacteroidales bacterium]
MLYKYSSVILTILLLSVSSCKNNSHPKEESKPQISTQSFHDAAYNGEIEKVKTSIESGVQADVIDENGQNALMLAAYNGHTEIVKILIKKGVDVNNKDNTDRTALIYASTGPFVETVQLLIDNKAEINVYDNVEHFTALMFAASEGQLEVVKVLMANGADASLKDIDGDTAENFAIQNGHMDVAAFLQTISISN